LPCHGEDARKRNGNEVNTRWISRARAFAMMLRMTSEPALQVASHALDAYQKEAKGSIAVSTDVALRRPQCAAPLAQCCPAELSAADLPLRFPFVRASDKLTIPVTSAYQWRHVTWLCQGNSPVWIP
jgi:hypothetical protein